MDDWKTILPLLLTFQSRLEESLDLAKSAEIAQVSPFQLHRKFKSLMGESPRSYLERLRLERAAFRLLIQRSDLLTIALDCGFSNPDTFTRAFRRRYGQTPSAWRVGASAKSDRIGCR